MILKNGNMSKYFFFLLTVLLDSSFLEAQSCRLETRMKTSKDIVVACYYFPNYHTRDREDPRISNQHWENWSEWELVKQAKPRFEGHHQPNVPAWGYTDEKDPKIMKKKIQTAVEYGIDVFIFDWYNYNGQPFLNRCLDEGFLKANNCRKIKFSLMWANHDWQDLYPYTLGEKKDWLYTGKVTPESFDKIGNELISKYFTQPNYWKIDGKAYFSIYDIQRFIDSFGSMEKTRKAMDQLRKKAIQSGLKGVHWNLIAWGMPILSEQDAPKDIPALIKALGFDSATSYVWIHHARLDKPQTDYNHVRNQYFAHWEKVKKTYSVPYYPNVTMGWDPTPRTNQEKPWKGNQVYPYTNTIGNNTPENFKRALQMTKERLLNDPDSPRIININCWNEWTEGSYLEPDVVHGYDYLKAVKAVFSK